jgi:hypothetical protein
LQEIEVRPAAFIDSDYFSVYDRSCRQIGQCFHDIGKLAIQRFSPPREQRDTSSGLDRQGSITVKLNFFCGARGYVALGMRGQLGRRGTASEAT